MARATKASIPERLTANMIHLAIGFPDWNSLDSVRRAHSDLEFTALMFFALLVISEAIAHLSKGEKKKRAFDTIGIIFFAIAVLAEIGAYPYGQRNDTLSENTITSLDQKAKDSLASSGVAMIESNTARDISRAADKVANSAMITAAGALKEAKSSEREIASTRTELRELGPRYKLLLNKKSEFQKALKDFPGQKIILRTKGNPNPETEALLGIMEINFFRNHWIFIPQFDFDVETSLIFVDVSKSAPDNTQKAALALATVLHDAGLLESSRARLVETDDVPKYPDDTIELIVGQHF